ncbi:MAG TPA: GNAT family N-acetyltransferase [Gemmatimonadales bacterium]|nr:GNAT family N-acetyltransferase [Gemmatimonadales bacterium]
MPPLPTARLRFELWTEVDLGLALELWGDPEVSRYISAGGFSRDEIQARLQREIANGRDHGVQYWRLRLRETDDFVGCCGLKPARPAERVYELGFQLRPAFWGQRLAGEAARASVDYAFTTLGAAGLIAGHHPENVASRRLLESLGFQYTHDTFYPPTGLRHREYWLPA